MDLARGLRPALQSLQGCPGGIVGQHCPAGLQRRTGKADWRFSAYDARRSQAISGNDPASLPARETAVAGAEAPDRRLAKCQRLRARFRLLAPGRFLHKLSFTVRRNAFGNARQVKISVALKMLGADCEIGCHADIRNTSPPTLIMDPIVSLRLSLRLMQAGLEPSLLFNKPHPWANIRRGSRSSLASALRRAFNEARDEHKL